MRALKKRLSGNKNYREVMLALTVRICCFGFFFSFYRAKLELNSPDVSVGVVSKNGYALWNIFVMV